MGYDYEIHYRRGNDNNAANALSRMPKSEFFHVSLQTCSDFLFLEIQKSWDENVDLQALKAHLQQKGHVEGNYSWDGQHLRRNGRLVVGNIPSVRQKILEWLHASPQGGHSASTLAQEFLDHVYKLHGSLVEIISDRDPLFISNFWRESLKVLGVEQKLTSSYHPQIDGQSEVPRMHIPYLPRDVVVEAVDRTFSAREETLAMVKYHLNRAVNRMKQKADLHRSDREFEEGQWVFLKLQPYRQISTASRSSQKLAPRYFGPYRICKKIGPVAYELELPPKSRVHSTLHVSLLKLCTDPSVKQQHPPIDWPESPSDLIPDKILNEQRGRRKGRIITEVLVKWKNLPDEEASWISLFQLQKQHPSFVTSNP
ncbi:uncharacterized protein LOC129320365 [Prosopis cineraria]|uniref:uncharacterized protein LOC129320365 n=1 Tax=Prosopis cineraria TaxID=364024 RepID=UPI00241063FA|nr:uncharacterized protein LOC129320365 [Prosopis cineraria]